MSTQEPLVLSKLSCRPQGPLGGVRCMSTRTVENLGAALHKLRDGGAQGFLGPSQTAGNWQACDGCHITFRARCMTALRGFEGVASTQGCTPRTRRRKARQGGCLGSDESNGLVSPVPPTLRVHFATSVFRDYAGPEAVFEKERSLPSGVCWSSGM